MRAVHVGETYCCLTSFFSDCRYALVAKIQPDKVVRWCADGEFLAIFLHPVFSASRVQHVSDLHPKFTMCGSMVDIHICDG